MKRTLFRSCLISLLIAILLELSLFNIRHYELLFSHAATGSTMRNPDDWQLVEISDGEQTVSAFQTEIDLKDGLIPDLHNISLQFEYPFDDRIVQGEVFLDMKKDVAGQSKAFQIVPDVPQSTNFAVHPIQKVEKLLLTVYTEEAPALLIAYNQPLQLEPHLIRIIAVWLFLWFLYTIRPNSLLYQFSLDLSLSWQKISLLVLLVLQFGFTVFTTLSSYPDLQGAVSQGNRGHGLNYNKRHYYYLTEALANGSLSLTEMTPPESLHTLDNPYDFNERVENGIIAYEDYAFDTVWYNDQYYVYYGVIPVLTLLLPYRLLTGQQLFLDFAALFYALLSSFGLLYVYTWFVKRFFLQIRWLVYWIGAAILLNSSTLIWLMRRVHSYEFAFISAFFFVVCGFALNLRSVEKGNPSRWRMTLGCLLMACAIGCRPMTLFASLLNIPLFWPYFCAKQRKKGIKWLLDVLSAAIPYFVIAAVLMSYNYLRFGSVTEFGQFYQLSDIDNLAYKESSPLPEYLIGIINLLFGANAIQSSTFPFLTAAEPLKFGYDGAIVWNNIFSVGTIFPLLYVLLILPFCYRFLPKKPQQFWVMCGIMVFCAVLISALDCAFVGWHQRYLLDFAWLIELAAMLVVFLFVKWFEQRNVQVLSNMLLALCLVYSLIFFLRLSLGEGNWFELSNPINYHQIAYLFTFWL